MYNYSGARTVDDLYTFATGGWKQTTGKVRFVGALLAAAAADAALIGDIWLSLLAAL